MKRTVPEREGYQVTLYMRTYYSLLRTTEAVQIRTLEETHMAMDPLLHPNAAAMAPDMSAVVYTSLRLPKCILDVRQVVLGQSEEVFQHRGYPQVETWQVVTAPARRRRMFHDGSETLAVYIASISDIDDIVPMLTAFQIEWNKMHTLIGLQAGLGDRLLAAAEAGSLEPALQAETRRILQLSEDDWHRLETVWDADLLELLAHVGASRKRMSVQLLAGSHMAYRRATQNWWDRVNRHVPFDLSERPIYFVSSNTHSLVNMVTCFAQAHEARLMDYLASRADPELCEEAERIQQRIVPTNWANFLYYTLKKYLQVPEGQDLLAAQKEHDAG